MQNIIVLLVLALAIFATTGSKVEEKASDGGIFHVKVRTSNIGRIKYEDGEVLLAQNLEKPTDIFFTPFPRVDPSSTECQENELSGQTELILSVDLYTSHLIRDVHAYINKRYPTLCNGDVEENMTTKCDVSLLPMNAIRLVQKGLRSNMSRLKYLVDDQWHSNTLLLQSVQFIIYTHNISVCHQARSAIVDRCQMSNFEIQYSLYSEKIVERQIEITSEHVTSSSMFNHIRSQLPTTDIVALTGNDFKQLLNEVTDRVTMKLRVQEGFDSFQDPVSIDKLLERQLQFKQVQLEKADDRLWDSLYWTKEQMRPDRLSKVLNIVFRKESNDSDHFVYDSNAAKNSQKLHLTQHDIDQFEKLDKFLSTYLRTSSTLGSQHGQGQGSVSFAIGPYRFDGGGGGSHHSHSQNSQIPLQNVIIPENAQWIQHGITVAGGNEKGHWLNQLNEPMGLWNSRVVRWPRDANQIPEILIANCSCYGLAIDEEGFLYTSNSDEHMIRRWQVGSKQGTIVAGGNGQGNELNQLNTPTSMFVTRNRSLYVADYTNNRVIKWEEGAKQGIVVAGGRGSGSKAMQLFRPHGVIVDQLGTVYVADYGNHRIMRWPKGAEQGTVLIGEKSPGAQPDQLNGPVGILFDQKGNLYVGEYSNHRVQRFNIKPHLYS
ncbi:unnamed protein product [Rotaria sp. Silwood1]|nr:unnamed protein product [Rotaria sp. Silwood1]